MQILPVLGSALFVAAAVFTGHRAITQPNPQIALVGDLSGGAAPQGADRDIRLVPEAKGDAFFAAITDRPLFEATRRPVATPTDAALDAGPAPILPQAADSGPQPLPSVRLLGVLAGGARNTALLSFAGDDPQWQAEGALIDGWTLSRIAADHIILTDQDRILRVELYQR